MIRWRQARTVAAFEFLSTVKRVGYLVATFGMPVFIALYGVVVGVPVYFIQKNANKPVVYGVVDGAGVLGLEGETAAGRPAVPDDVRQALETAGQKGALDRALVASRLVFRPYAGEADARHALVASAIKGYFVIPPDYMDTGVVDAYSPDAVTTGGSDARSSLGRLLRERLLAGRVDAKVAERVTTPVKEARRFTVTRDGAVTDGGVAASVVRVVVPVLFMVLFLVSVIMSSGYLLQGTATEKENKVVEVLLASANADEILAGKLVGLGGAGLLQIATWLVMVLVLTVGVAPLLVAAHVSVPWLALAVAVPFFLVAYLFFGSLMLGSGSLGSTMREAQQYAMVFSLMALVPLMLMSLLITDPHGSVARVLTWVPFSAAPLVVLRASLDPGALAWWEIAGAFAVLVLSTWGAIWLGARLFRIGLLAGGTRVKLRDVIRQARALG